MNDETKSEPMCLTAEERELIEAFRKQPEKKRAAFLKQAKSGKTANTHFQAGKNLSNQ